MPDVFSKGGGGVLKRKTRDDDDEMDITPMIDITFLLLIFFLVASKMDESVSLELPPARHGHSVGNRNAVVISITAEGPDGGAKIYKGEKETEFVGDAIQQEEEITEYVQQELTDNLKKLNYVVIKAEQNVKHGDVSRVAKAVGKAEVPEEKQQLYVAVMEST